MFARRPGLWATGILLAGAAYAYISRPPAPRDDPVISMRTTGVQNIEKAYTNAGATPTHTKAYGGTKQGSNEDVALREGGGTGGKKYGSPMDKEGLGGDQKAQTQTGVEDVLAHSNYGTKKGRSMSFLTWPDLT